MSKPRRKYLNNTYMKKVFGWKGEKEVPAPFVYVLQCPLTKRIKIGKSGNPLTRLVQIRSHCPAPPVMLAIIDGEDGDVLESKLHDHFKSYRVHGEWFTPGPELLAWIASLEPFDEAAWAA